MHRHIVGVIGGAVVTLLAGTAIAFAAGGQDRDARRAASARAGTDRPTVVARRETKPARAADAAPRQQAAPAGPPRPQEPLLAVISLSSQHIDVYGPNGTLHRSRVSSGQSGYATPTGVFSVLQRNRYHESNIYSGAPMPYMQRLTWSGIALHEGYVPGYPASHGCIRLPTQSAQTLWEIGRLGMRVVVSPSDVQPLAFNHPKLPQPRVRTDVKSAGLVVLAAAGEMQPPPEASRPMQPFELAHSRLARATDNKSASEKAVKPAFDLATQKSAEANQATEALKASAGILQDAIEHLELENFGMATVQTEAAEATILARIKIAQAGVAAAREAHEKLRAAERAASDAAFAGASAAREAREAAEAAVEELRQARRGTEPISIFVSRKTGRAYVRQGFAALGDEPIKITDPERPLGTHVFTAMDTPGDGREVRWSVVNVPTAGGETSRAKGSRPVEDHRASSPAEALERIELPADFQVLMSERLWPGASMIISDYGLGETGEGTDFVIVTR